MPAFPPPLPLRGFSPKGAILTIDANMIEFYIEKHGGYRQDAPHRGPRRIRRFVGVVIGGPVRSIKGVVRSTSVH